jgi:GGDEF domain-containing protein
LVRRSGSDDGGAEEREKDELQRELLRELGQTITVEQKDILSLQESFGVSLLDWKATDIADESLHVRAPLTH